MPMHDWTRAGAGAYHNFRFLWVAALIDRLNAGLLPAGFFAMAERSIGQPESDCGMKSNAGDGRNPQSEIRNPESRGCPIAPVRSRTRFVLSVPPEQERYARKTHRVIVRHELGDVVAVIEIVSPGNKDRLLSLQTFVWKAVDLIQQQVNLMVIDPFPPGQHDPEGVPATIWSEFSNEPFELPKDKPLTLAAFQVEPIKTAHIETIAVGDPLPDMPLFLYGEFGIDVPLEETYQTTWGVLPIELRELVETAPRQ